MHFRSLVIHFYSSLIFTGRQAIKSNTNMNMNMNTQTNDQFCGQYHLEIIAFTRLGENPPKDIWRHIHQHSVQYTSAGHMILHRKTTTKNCASTMNVMWTSSVVAWFAVETIHQHKPNQNEKSRNEKLCNTQYWDTRTRRPKKNSVKYKERKKESEKWNKSLSFWIFTFNLPVDCTIKTNNSISWAWPTVGIVCLKLNSHNI